MTRFKDFGAGAAPESTEALSFKLHGEEFACVPEIQGAVLLHLVESGQNPDGATSAAMILEFFDTVLTDESAERFNKLITSKDKIVKVETLGEITGWLIEEYTNRPESQPED